MGSEDMDLACPRPSQLKPELKVKRTHLVLPVVIKGSEHAAIVTKKAIPRQRKANLLAPCLWLSESYFYDLLVYLRSIALHKSPPPFSRNEAWSEWRVSSVRSGDCPLCNSELSTNDSAQQATVPT